MDRGNYNRGGPMHHRSSYSDPDRGGPMHHRSSYPDRGRPSGRDYRQYSPRPPHSRGSHHLSGRDSFTNRPSYSPSRRPSGSSQSRNSPYNKDRGPRSNHSRGDRSRDSDSSHNRHRTHQSDRRTTPPPSSSSDSRRPDNSRPAGQETALVKTPISSERIAELSKQSLIHPPNHLIQMNRVSIANPRPGSSQAVPGKPASRLALKKPITVPVPKDTTPDPKNQSFSSSSSSSSSGSSKAQLSKELANTIIERAKALSYLASATKRPLEVDSESTPAKVVKSNSPSTTGASQPVIKIRNDIFNNSLPSSDPPQKVQTEKDSKKTSSAGGSSQELTVTVRIDPVLPATKSKISSTENSEGLTESVKKKKVKAVVSAEKVPNGKESSMKDKTTSATNSAVSTSDKKTKKAKREASQKAQGTSSSSKESSPELQIVSEKLVTRRPVLVYGDPVSADPVRETNETDVKRFKKKKTLVNLSSTANLPIVEIDVPGDRPNGNLGYIWPIKSKETRVINTKNSYSLGAVQEDTQASTSAQTTSAPSTPTKVTDYFSPKKGTPSKLNNGAPAAELKSPTTPKSSKKKNETSERRSTFLNLTAFKKILINVAYNHSFAQLINAEDSEVIRSFIDISEEAKAVLVHLSSVKLQWRRLSDLKYPEIGTEVENAIDDLLEQQFLLPDTSLTDLREMLELLKLKEVQELGKTYKLDATSKGNIIESLIKHGQRQRGIMGNLTDKIVKDVKKLLGKCIKVNTDRTEVLYRMCLLDTLAYCFEDKSLSDILFRANQVLFDKISFPEYTIYLKTNIFMNRENLIRFHKAYLLYKDLEKSMEMKNHIIGGMLTKEAWAQFKEILNSEDFQKIREHDSKLPEHLQKFTAGSTLARTMTKGLDSLTKQKEYDTAVHILRDLLNQKTYCQRCRGKWYERISLILHKHLKTLGEAADLVCQGIEDTKVQLVYKIALSARARVLQKSKAVVIDEKAKERLIICSQGPVLSEAANRSIQGRVKTTSGVPGQKMNFIIENDNPDEMKIGSVEEVAISHYKRIEGFQKGRHNEGGTIIALFALLFWDEIYDVGVPDAFISPYQTQPIDLYTYDFYKKRQKSIDKKLNNMEHWSNEESLQYFTTKWEESEGKNSILPKFAFQDAKEAHSLYKCIGVEKTSKICLKLIKDFRNSRSGFPDLVVWTPGEKNKYKFVEVKSPNDTLQDNQKVWIDFLMKSDIPVEVCHVNTVGEKYLSLLKERESTVAEQQS